MMVVPSVSGIVCLMTPSACGCSLWKPFSMKKACVTTRAPTLSGRETPRVETALTRRGGLWTATIQGKSKKVKGKRKAESHILINSGSPPTFYLFTFTFLLIEHAADSADQVAGFIYDCAARVCEGIIHLTGNRAGQPFFEESDDRVNRRLGFVFR
jgi:hypothetical protein